MERWTHATAKAPVDRVAMRVLPLLAKGVGGTMPGTNPLAEVIQSDGRSRRRKN